MKEKDKKLWLELYEIAKKIQELEPWKYLSDQDILTYLDVDTKEIYYCCTMGLHGLHKAVSVYKGKQIHKYLELANNEYPFHAVLNYQDCLICDFISREDTLPENRKIIKELGLKFRGTWISFESFEKGYEPCKINIEQVRILIKTLNEFYMLYKEIIENNVNPKFMLGETLARFYDKESHKYINEINKLMIPEKELGTIELPKDLEKKLKQLPKKNIELEYDFLNYIPIRIIENKESDGRYYYPRVRYLVTKNLSFVSPPELIDKNKYKNELEYISESMNLLVNRILNTGLPKKIYVRDEETKALLQELEDKIKIKIIVSPKLEEIDDFLSSLSEAGIF